MNGSITVKEARKMGCGFRQMAEMAFDYIQGLENDIATDEGKYPAEITVKRQTSEKEVFFATYRDGELSDWVVGFEIVDSELLPTMQHFFEGWEA